MEAPSDSAEGNLNPPTPTARFDLIPDEDLKVFIGSIDSEVILKKFTPLHKFRIGPMTDGNIQTE